MNDQPTESNEYHEAVQAILKPTDDLRRQNQRIAVALRVQGVAIVIALIAITLGFIAIIRSNHDRQQRALADYRSKVAACQSANAFRAADYQSWQFIIKLPQPPHTMTPEQQAQTQANTKAFLVFKQHQDAQMDCSKIPHPGIDVKTPPRTTVTLVPPTTS